MTETTVETTRCRSCGAPIYFGLTKNQKRCPFDVDPKTGEPTEVSHFESCPDAKGWSRRGK